MKVSISKLSRNTIWLSAILMFSSSIWGCASGAIEISQDEGYISDYPELDGYGRWFTVPPYGEVWQPYVVDNWQPFTYGKWAWTDRGWAWVSYEPYGWLVFHYGFWDFQPSLGWFWIPGDQWSPARVQWVEYGDYICWAPLAPPNVVWPEPWEHSRHHYWVTVHQNRFLDDDIGGHRISGFPGRGPERIIIRNREPKLGIIERSVHHPIPMTRIRHEPVRSRNHEYQRMRIPEEERKSIEKRREQTRREILRPAPRRVQHQRTPERKQESGTHNQNEKERHEERRDSGQKEHKHNN
jgi:hypothetical protein